MPEFRVQGTRANTRPSELVKIFIKVLSASDESIVKPISEAFKNPKSPRSEGTARSNKSSAPSNLLKFRSQIKEKLLAEQVTAKTSKTQRSPLKLTLAAHAVENVQEGSQNAT